MSKKRIIVHDDQILVDMELIFAAIREADGDWQTVEQELYDYFSAMNEVLIKSDELQTKKK